MHIVHARVTTKTTLQPIFEKTAGLYNFKGKVAESHRLFLFCADLFMEAKAIPWATVPSWDETARPTIEWLLTQTGPQDVLDFCDGRSRSWRGKLEELLKEMRHFSEMWVVYQPSPRLGRKVSFGSDNREVILVSTPVARRLLPVRGRAQFGAAGESSTHDSSYTGVPPLPWGGVPHLSSSDKAKILGHEIEEPPDRLFDTSLGQPLFWAERKSNGFFQRLFQDLSAKVVIDCMPGCGSAGRACLDLGLQYLAFWPQCRARLLAGERPGSRSIENDLCLRVPLVRRRSCVRRCDSLQRPVGPVARGGQLRGRCPTGRGFLCLSPRQCLGDTAGHPMNRQGRCNRTLKLMSCGFAVCVATYQLCITESRLL